MDLKRIEMHRVDETEDFLIYHPDTLFPIGVVTQEEDDTRGVYIANPGGRKLLGYRMNERFSLELLVTTWEMQRDEQERNPNAVVT